MNFSRGRVLEALTEQKNSGRIKGIYGRLVSGSYVDNLYSESVSQWTLFIEGACGPSRGSRITRSCNMDRGTFCRSLPYSFVAKAHEKESLLLPVYNQGAKKKTVSTDLKQVILSVGQV